MSRIGKKTIKIPQGVTAEVKDDEIRVKGPKGELKRQLNPLVWINIADGEIKVDVKNKEEKRERSLWGTFGAHIQNMIDGVVHGFKKELEINGVGYRAALQGKDLKLEVGYSHPVIFKVPAEVKASVDKNLITLESADVELLGDVAARLRATKPPEPYKGKGIKYVKETIRHKAGKTAAGATAGA